MANSANHPPLVSELLESLVVPTAFRNYESAPPGEKAGLDEWAAKAVLALNELNTLLRDKSGGLKIEELGSVVARVAPFMYSPASLNESVYEEERNILNNESPWITSNAKQVAQDVLETLRLQLDDEKLVKYVLDHVVKPIFRASNPHPHINPSTGKSLPQSQINRAPQQGGVSSITQDFFEGEGQKWKYSVGLEAVLFWCIDHIKPTVYDDVWHLVIPPLMTLLDDYQPRYKLWGLLIAGRMLRDVPATLLKKTGIHGLLDTSFKKVLAHQDSPLSPTIIRLAISQSLRLTVLTTLEGSKPRFDALCALLGEGIINTVWTYTFDKPEVVRATLDALPPVIKALDIGCARFIQSLMPQLIHPLTMPSEQGLPPSDLLQVQLQLASLRVLVSLMSACAPRIYEWRSTILDALVRRWAVLADHADFVGDSSPYSFSVPAAQEGDSDDEEERDELVLTLPMAPSGFQKCASDAEAIQPADHSSVEDNLACLKSLLQLASYQLLQICPSMATNEYPRLIQADSILFKGLLPVLEKLGRS